MLRLSTGTNPWVWVPIRVHTAFPLICATTPPPTLHAPLPPRPCCQRRLSPLVHPLTRHPSPPPLSVPWTSPPRPRPCLCRGHRPSPLSMPWTIAPRPCPCHGRRPSPLSMPWTSPLTPAPCLCRGRRPLALVCAMDVAPRPCPCCGRRPSPLSVPWTSPLALVHAVDVAPHPCPSPHLSPLAPTLIRAIDIAPCPCLSPHPIAPRPHPLSMPSIVAPRPCPSPHPLPLVPALVRAVDIASFDIFIVTDATSPSQLVHQLKSSLVPDRVPDILETGPHLCVGESKHQL